MSGSSSSHLLLYVRSARACTVFQEPSREAAGLCPVSAQKCQLPPSPPPSPPLPPMPEFMEIGGVQIPVPMRSRTVTNADVVKASRTKEGKTDLGDVLTESEKFVLTMFPVESCRRVALGRGRTVDAASTEALLVKDALLAMHRDQWLTLLPP